MIPSSIRKKPLGAMPRKIWQEHRVVTLLEAVIQYIDNGYSDDKIILEWMKEAIEILEDIIGRS